MGLARRLPGVRVALASCRPWRRVGTASGRSCSVADQPFSTGLAAESVCHGASRSLRRRVIGPRSWVGLSCCSKTLTLADRLEMQNTELRLTKIDGDTWLERTRSGSKDRGGSREIRIAHQRNVFCRRAEALEVCAFGLPQTLVRKHTPGSRTGTHGRNR